MRLNFIASGGGIALFCCARIAKSASSGVNLKFERAALQAVLARERHKSAGLNLNAAERRFNLLFATRWRRAAILKFNDLKSAQVGA